MAVLRLAAPIIAVAIMLIVAATSSSYILNAARDLPNSVSQGGSFDVIVNFTSPADGFNSIGIHEEAPEGWNILVDKEWCDPNADFAKATASTAEYVWYGPYDANASFTVVYQATAPSDATGIFAFNGTAEFYIGEDGPYKEEIGGDKEVEVAPGIFDTGTGTYPSIFGMHSGVIIPNKAISAGRLYTYPCLGTGGHSEYVKIWNSTWGIEAYWNGYKGDWRNITFPVSFMLKSGETYNYTIRTGSYPQIIHEKEFNATGGKITCKEFVDANGRIYDNWIPAIKLCYSPWGFNSPSLRFLVSLKNQVRGMST